MKQPGAAKLLEGVPAELENYILNRFFPLDFRDGKPIETFGSDIEYKYGGVMRRWDTLGRELDRAREAQQNREREAQRRKELEALPPRIPDGDERKEFPTPFPL